MLVVCFLLGLDVGVCLYVGVVSVGVWMVALVCGWKEGCGMWIVDGSKSQNNCEWPHYDARISRPSHPTA